MPSQLSGTKKVARTRRGWFFWCCLLCAVPVLLPIYPPMVDAPQHAAQVAALKHLLAGDDWAYSGLFELQLFTPYIVGYLLVLMLSWLVEIPLAVKLVVAAAVVAFPLAGARLADEASRGGAWRWMLLPLPFGFAYQWGFLNFLVAAPLGMLFLFEVIRARERGGWRSGLLIALWLHLLFVAHILTAFFFGVVGMLLLAAPWSGFRGWIRRSVPVFSVLPVAILWMWLNRSNAPSSEAMVIWNIGIHRVVEFLPGLVSSPDKLVGQLVGLLFMAMPFLLGAKPKQEAGEWMPFVFYLLWMLLFPHYLAGTFFTYQRFGIFGLPLYMLAFDWRGAGAGRQEYLRSLVPGLVLVCLSLLGWQAIRASTFNREVAGYREVIAHAQPEKRLLTMAFDPISKASVAPLMVHFGSWYQAEKDGLAEYSFSEFWGVPARFRSGAPTVIWQGFEWRPDLFEWDGYRGELYDYFLIRHPQSAEHWMAERSGGRVVLLARSAEWQLYARSDQVAAAPPHSRSNQENRP